jgi:brefeldin A-inhibited guanine nucleotide-exchange protein
MVEEGVAYRKRRHLEDPITKAKITQAVALFNNKPKKGLQFLIDEKVIPDTPSDKAEFLLNNKKLDKVKIGEILGEPDEGELLSAFGDRLEYRGMEVCCSIFAY